MQLELRSRHGQQPLAIAVLDAGGHLVAFQVCVSFSQYAVWGNFYLISLMARPSPFRPAQREDGRSIHGFEIAFAKAAGALGMGMHSRALNDKLASRPAFQVRYAPMSQWMPIPHHLMHHSAHVLLLTGTQNAMAAITRGHFAPVPGGVLLLDSDGWAIGAVGVTGDSGDMDEFFAIAAVKAVIAASGGGGGDSGGRVCASDPAEPKVDPRILSQAAPKSKL